MFSIESHIFQNSNFVPAEVQHHKKSNGYLLVYYVRNPITGVLECKRNRLNKLRKKYSSVNEFKVAAKRICDEINAKLVSGWTPYGESLTARLYEPLVPTLDSFVESKSKELTEDTIRSYRSTAKLLAEWLGERCSGITCGSFTKALAIKFMEDRWSQKITARTFNNNLKTCRTIWEWLIEHGYAKENAFASIKTKLVTHKARTFIPVDILMNIFRYVSEEHPQFYMVLLLIYYSGLRPKEVTRLKVGQVDFDRSCIILDPTQTKNHKDGISYLSSELVDMLKEHTQSSGAENFIFGASTYRPGPVPITENVLCKYWAKVRERMELPKEFQLYSLRDSSGVHRFNQGLSAMDIMHSLRHSDLKQTTIYTDHMDEGLKKRLQESTPHI